MKSYLGLIGKRKRQKYASYINNKMEDFSWSIKDGKNLCIFPGWLRKQVYSKVEMVIVSGRYVKGRVIYHYIPGEYTIDMIPIIIDVEISTNRMPLPEGTIFLSYRELQKIFINNKFE